MIIALTGQKRSGKDSLASHLVNDLGFVRLAFADPIRQVVLGIDPWLADARTRLSQMVEGIGWEGAKESEEVRRLLQVTGEEMRLVDPDIWTRVLIQQLETRHALNPDLDVVITDVRLPQEAEVLTEYDPNARVVRVVRPSLPIDGSRATIHFTETAMARHEVFTEVVNDADLETLRVKAHRLVAAVSADTHPPTSQATA